jgi:2-keto-4-pentenoate hydratase/2-oxohepta-3-ene-1,7-dioic acid hydratase in catechol pathway
MKIICIARNYVEHIRELNDGGRVTEDPVFFLKPDTALLRNNSPFYLPDFSDEIHYETELVVRISRTARSVEERFAHRYYDQVGLGLDLTARDLQHRCIAEGLPWEICKGFDNSAVISPQMISLDELGGDAGKLHFEMELNGTVRQRGDTSLMIFPVDRIISYVSRFIMLRMGDLIYTGTPVGVGPLAKGDHLVARLEGRDMINMLIK